MNAHPIFSRPASHPADHPASRPHFRFGHRLPALLVTLLMALPLAAPPASAAPPLGPTDLIVVYNKGVKGGKLVAGHYLRARNIPKDHLVAVKLPTGEAMDRDDLPRLVKPVATLAKQIRSQGGRPVVVLTYGIPLKLTTQRTRALQNRFRDTVEKGRKAARKRLTTALAELAATTGKAAPPDGLSDADLLRHGRERAMAAGALLSAAMHDPERQDEALALGRKLGAVSGVGSIESREAFKGWLTFRGVPTDAMVGMAAQVSRDSGALGELSFWTGLQGVDPANQIDASVDSELALAIAGPFQPAARLPNPWLARYDGTPGIDAIRADVTPVARLDGPTPQSVTAMIDAALQTEQTGLTGTLYVDARGLGERTAPEKRDSYARFDQSLRDLYQLTKDRFPASIDNAPRVLPPGSAPNAALYVGWYSMGNYVDAFNWVPGAVGYHAASVEAQRLHDPRATMWVKRMIEDGVAATIGPVAEPFLDAFPRPDAFFPLLMQGDQTLVEVYYRTIPHLSWRQVLFGDPLYRPFKANPVRR